VPVILGVDEAGYGPVLGPLVVAATAWRVDFPVLGAPDTDLWKILSRSTSRTYSARSNKTAIADSKKLYQRGRKDALARLEESALTLVACCGGPVRRLADLLHRLDAGIEDQLGEYPWYANSELALPASASDLRVAALGRTLAADAEARGVQLLSVQARPTLEGRFNRLVGPNGNKAATHLSTTLNLLHQVRTATGDRQVLACIDKQGGRDTYTEPLLRTFDGCRLIVLREGGESSAYRIEDDQGAMEVRFETGGEDRHLPAAAASLIAKYVREAMMILFNRFWVARLPDLAPTAGYYTDAQRFLADVRSSAAELNLPDELWIRSK